MEPIAITGLSCRFPGAPSPDAFWELLRNGATAVRELPSGRWSATAVSRSAGANWGGFLERLDLFDAAFFRIADSEAERIDPQQRLLLELCWEALEDADLVPARLRSTATGVFIGFGVPEYQLGQLNAPDRINAYTNTGYFPCIQSNRISYVFDFCGPSVSLDTACSSSLVALHLACQSLRSKESTLALVGGVSLMVSPVTSLGYCQQNLLSPDGRCYAFDARANGYVRGEGGGILVLKCLSAALADGDEIKAVIRGEAVNQDGRSNGLTAPNRFAQEAVIRRACADAGISPDQVQYVEAHGTGTLIGDAIEAGALGAVFGPNRLSGSPCRIGSVKTNIGHLESAAGIASIIKTVLALKHRMLPPTLHFQTPNPHIPFDALHLRVQTTCEPWPSCAGAPIAAVHAYGLGGTNAHVVLEAPPRYDELRGSHTDERTQRDPADLHAQLLPVSARTETALAVLADAYRDVLRRAPEGDISLADVCHAAARRRTHFPRRIAVVASTTAQAAERLEALLESRAGRGISVRSQPASRRPKIAFLFTGQGSQYAGMARALYASEPVFHDALDECGRRLDPYVPRPLLDVLFGSDDALLNQTAYTQPTLFALEYAVASLWRAWGITPDAVLGHSVGELAAACVAGVFSLDEGLRFVATRGRLMQQLPAGGGMAAVLTGESRTRRILAPLGSTVSIAAINGQEEVTIAGADQAVGEALEILGRHGVACCRLDVSHAFHSPMIDPVLDELDRTACAMSCRPPEIPLVSNVTGAVVNRTPLDGAYWRRHARAPVRFADGIDALLDLGCRVFVEVGPHPTLLGMMDRAIGGRAADARKSQCLMLPSLRKDRDDREQMLESLGALYCEGAEVDWPAVHWRPPQRRVKAPTYPFERQRHWFAPEDERQPSDAASDAGARRMDLCPNDAAVPATRAQDRFDVPWLLRSALQDGSSERRARLVTALIACASEVIGSPLDALDVRQPLAEFGLTSSTAVELCTRLSSAVGYSLPVSVVFDYPSIDALADYLSRQMVRTTGVDAAISTVAAPSTPTVARSSSRYDDLTEQELADLLSERLASANGRRTRDARAMERRR